MAQLLSSLLPEEAILVRKDQKIGVVIAEKDSQSKTIWSHRVRRNQHIRQTDTICLPCVKKVSTNSSHNSLPKFYLSILRTSNIFLHARWPSKCPTHPVCFRIRTETRSLQYMTNCSIQSPVNEPVTKYDSKNITQCRYLWFAQLARYYQCSKTRVGYDDLITQNTCRHRQVHVTSTGNQESSHMEDSKKSTGELKIKLHETAGRQTRLNCLEFRTVHIPRNCRAHTSLFPTNHTIGTNAPTFFGFKTQWCSVSLLAACYAGCQI